MAKREKVKKLPEAITEEGKVEKLRFYGDAKKGHREKALLFVGGRKNSKGLRGTGAVKQHQHPIEEGITELYTVLSGDIWINGQKVEPGDTRYCGLGQWHNVEGSGTVMTTKYPVHKTGYDKGEEKL